MGTALALSFVGLAWMGISGVPMGVERAAAVGIAILVPFTAGWISILVGRRRTRVSLYLEGFTTGGERPESVPWNDVAALRRAKNDADGLPLDWVVETRDGRVVHLPGWLIQPDVDLAPLRDRGFELPEP